MSLVLLVDSWPQQHTVREVFRARAMSRDKQFTEWNFFFLLFFII